MSTEDRLAEILLKAMAPLEEERFRQAEQREIDTSCPHVPFGFVRTGTLSLSVGQQPDEFWAYAISVDQFLDPLSAKIEALSSSRLEPIFATIRLDLARIGETDMFAGCPTLPVEVFSVERACQHCSGQVMLMRYSDKATYLHWHRES